MSHASEDKNDFVRPLAERLGGEGLEVWYDEWELKLGDGLLRKIDEGLSKSRYGIVVLSKAFFNKDWPRKELDGLDALEVSGRKVILPIWHDISFEEVRGFSPILAARLAARSSEGLDSVVRKILDVVRLNTAAAVPVEAPRALPPTGTAAEWRDPKEYMAQRQLLPETPVYKALLSKPRWRIWIRPCEFKRARFRDSEHCRQFISSQRIRVNSVMSSYPRFEQDRLEIETEWISGEAEKSGTVVQAERWNLFRSGQFILYAALNEIAQMGNRLHVLEILDTVFAAFILAARMEREGVLTPRAAITIELFDIAGREISWPQGTMSYEDKVPGQCWCQDDHVSLTRVLTAEDLKSRHIDFAIDLMLEILAKFGWVSAPRELFLDVAANRFQ